MLLYVSTLNLNQVGLYSKEEKIIMTEKNIPPMEKAWEVDEMLGNILSVYLGYVKSDKLNAQRTADWAGYHRATGKMLAYREVLRLLEGLNIRRDK